MLTCHKAPAAADATAEAASDVAAPEVAPAAAPEATAAELLLSGVQMLNQVEMLLGRENLGSLVREMNTAERKRTFEVLQQWRSAFHRAENRFNDGDGGGGRWRPR